MAVTQNPQQTSSLKVGRVLILGFHGTVAKTHSGSIFPANAQDILIPEGMSEKILQYRNAGYVILCISNPSSVAFGFKSASDIQLEYAVTMQLLKLNFDGVSISFNRQGGTVSHYGFRSLLELPSPGLIMLLERDLLVQKSFVIDYDRSLFVGSTQDEKECAARVPMAFCEVEKFLSSPVISIEKANDPSLN